MNSIVVILQISSAAAGLAAAWLWLRASQGSAPEESWKGRELQGYLDAAAAKNRRAALWTALSVLLGVFATMAGWLQPKGN